LVAGVLVGIIEDHVEPTGIHPKDAKIELISRSVPERDQAVMFSVFDRMGQYHPPQPHWHLSLIEVEP
jgi:hypothetical protein